MVDAIQIRESGDANGQVTDRVKEKIFSWLRDRDVDTDEVVLHHYKDGDFVAVSWWGSGAEDTRNYNSAHNEAVSEYWRNREVNDDCFWIHREWIDALD